MMRGLSLQPVKIIFYKSNNIEHFEQKHTEKPELSGVRHIKHILQTTDDIEQQETKPLDEPTRDRASLRVE